MGRPPRRHHGATAKRLDPSELQIDWELVQADSGISLAKTVREKVRAATRSFLDRVPFERAAMPRNDKAISKKGSAAASAIAEIRATAAQLADLVTTNLHDERGAEACRLIAVNFRDLVGTKFSPPSNQADDSPPAETPRTSIFAPVHSLIETIYSLVKACDEAGTELAGLDAVASEYWKDGAAWNAWVRDLAAILQESGVLATTWGSDERQLTPFVQLVAAVEGFIPDDSIPLRKKVALTKAVSKALRSRA